MALRLSRSKPMEEGHKNLLISNMAILIEDLELSKLLPYMTPALDDEDFATIRSLPTKSEQVEMLVTILPERGDKAFHCFIQNLKIAQPDLVDRMFNKSASYWQGDDSKRILFKGTFTEEGSSLVIKEAGVWVKFSPKAVLEPKEVTCLLPRSSDDSSLPFEADESLVSSVIQLDCDDPKGVNFSGITVALSHSAPDLGGYELVMKELRIDSGKKTWKELKPTNEICVPPEPLRENCKWQRNLRFFEARITSFSRYAVICRLKSYIFSCQASIESTEHICQVPSPISTKHPAVTVTIPGRALPKDVELTIKAQEVPSYEFEEQGTFVGLILHVSCSMEEEFEEPTSIRIPVALEKDPQQFQNLTGSHRIYYRRNWDSSQDWRDITEELRLSDENGVVTFQVNHFPLLACIRDNCKRALLNCFSSAPQHVGFQAWLCYTGDPQKYHLTVCCYPIQLWSGVYNKASSIYQAIRHSYGEESPHHLINRGEVLCFILDGLIPCQESNGNSRQLRFHGDASSETSVRVYMDKTKSDRQIKFSKGNDRKETICTLTMAALSLHQGYPTTLQEMSGYPDQASLCETRNEPFTSCQILNIKDDVGTCWYDLGIALGIETAVVRNVEKDYQTSPERGQRVLEKWIELKGKNATVGRLACALFNIKQGQIAHKLLDSVYQAFEQSENRTVQGEEQAGQPTVEDGEQPEQPTVQGEEQAEQPPEQAAKQAVQPTVQEGEQSEQPTVQGEEQAGQQTVQDGGQSEQPTVQGGEQPEQPTVQEGEQGKQPTVRVAEQAEQPSKREGEQSEQGSERKPEQFEQRRKSKAFHKSEQSKQQSGREAEWGKQPSKGKGGQPMQPSGQDGEQPDQSRKRAGEQSGQPHTWHGDQSRQSIEWRGKQPKQPNQRRDKQPEQPHNRTSVVTKRKLPFFSWRNRDQQGEQSKQSCERKGNQCDKGRKQKDVQSQQPTEREGERSKEPKKRKGKQSKQQSDQERKQPEQATVGQGKLSVQSKEREGEQPQQPSERGEQSEQPSERQGEQSPQPSERQREQPRQPSEREIEQPEKPSERKGEQSPQLSERQGEQPQQTSEREGKQPKKPSESKREQSPQPSERERERSKHPSEGKTQDEVCRLLEDVKEWMEIAIDQDRQQKREELKKTIGECKKMLEKASCMGGQSMQPTGCEKEDDSSNLLAQIRQVGTEIRRQQNENDELTREIEGLREMKTKIQHFLKTKEILCRSQQSLQATDRERLGDISSILTEIRELKTIVTEIRRKQDENN